MAASRFFDAPSRPRNAGRTRTGRPIRIGLITILSAALVFSAGLANAEPTPEPTPSETQTLATQPTPTETEPVASSEPTPEPSQTVTEPAASESPTTEPSETPTASPEPETPATEPSSEETKPAVKPLAVAPAAEETHQAVAPLALGPDGGAPPYVHWTAKDPSDNPVEGVTFRLQGPRGQGTGGAYSSAQAVDVTDCVTATCTGPDLDPDPGEFLVKTIGTHSIRSERRYRLQAQSVPTGYTLTSPTGWQEITGSGSTPDTSEWPDQTHNFGSFIVTPITWTVTVKKGTYRTGTGSSDVSTEHTPGVRFGMFIDAAAATPFASCEITAANPGDCVFTNVTPPDGDRNVVIKELAPAAGSLAAANLGQPFTMLTTGTTTGGFTNRNYQIDATLPSGGGSLTLPAAGSGATIRGERVANRVKNPLLTQSCSAGAKVALVLDTSGSVDGYENTLAQAATALVNGLVGTPSSVALFSFATGTPGGVQNRPTPVSVQTTTGANDVKGWYSTNNGQTANFNATGGTNWDAALWATAQGSQANSYDIVFVLTDGNPTFANPSQTGDGSTTTFRELERAVFSANAIKKTGARIVTVGVGSGLSDYNLAAIAGPTKFTAGQTLNEFDYITAGWSQLEDVLRTFAQGLKCEATVTVEKQAKPYGGAFAPASGWNFGLSQTGAASQTPSTAQNTATNGQAVWTLKFSSPTGAANVVLTENENRPNWSLTDITCDVGGTTVNLGSKNVSITDVGVGENVKCTFKNEERLVGALGITKVLGDTNAQNYGSGVTFGGAYSCTLAGSTVASGTWTRVGAGAATLTPSAGSPAANQIPAGASCSVTETQPTGGLPNSSWQWSAPTVGAAVTIVNGQTQSVSVTNRVQRVYGNFRVTKELAAGSTADASNTYSGQWNCTLGSETRSGT